MAKLNVDFILFDLIGTTIKDTKGEGSLILDSFHEAFDKNGYQISYEELNQQRGKRKREAIQSLFATHHIEALLVDKVYFDFIDLLNQSVSSFSEMEGASPLFSILVLIKK